MGWIAFVRHGVTEWNELGLIQGRTDIPLSPAGVARLRQIQPSSDFLSATWVTSPLKRAVQTVKILNPDSALEVQTSLIETNWGEFEGIARSEIPQRIHDLALDPDHGLDLLPPGGESPRMVRQRLTEWLETIAVKYPAVVAVTHKGVIRTALSAACDWDMATDFSEKPDWSLPQLFRLDQDGKLHLTRLNCPWDLSISCP